MASSVMVFFDLLLATFYAKLMVVMNMTIRVNMALALKIMALLVGLAVPFSVTYAQASQDGDHGRPVEKVAKDLGVTLEQFREAFKKVTPAPRGELPTKAQREANRKVLSETLGVSPEKLDEVMDKYRPEGKTHGTRN